MVSPKEAVIAVTYRCNARCSMCNIWANPERDEILPEEYLKLPASLKTINVTGGEPFLRKDIVEVVRSIDSIVPRSRIVFSTNGLRTDLIVPSLLKIREFHRRLGVGISIDGTKDTHDRIRGVPGIFDSAITTVKSLRENGFGDLRIGMTLTRDNISEAVKVYQLSRSLGVEFTTTVAHNSEIYFQKTDNVGLDLTGPAMSSLTEIIESLLRSGSPKDWFRGYHLNGIVDPKIRREFASRCEAGRRYFFMSPNGDVYPCMVMNMRIGNISKVDRWDDLFSGGRGSDVAEAVQTCKEDCWMVCNTRSLIISHPFKAGAWVTKNKIRAHMSPHS